MSLSPSTRPDDLAGKVAIVTGAASGIGRATVELLVERGVRVVAEDRDDAVEELRGENVAPVADVTEEDSARRAVALARERFGRLDVLVNNAGVIIDKTVADMTLDHGSNTPIGRAAQPREIAEVIAFLASDRASYLVGSVAMTDGGTSVAAG
ncbi:enoyl-ACP reductase-like protein [Actinomycetospora succinea]|uniref:Enoyl-ACP reductase-like protein n=1 Tax=Actinomycetospora succinea TaxID=663603 RepID=A0A4R6UK67_9PSEU|nr:SDR family oxidoreductase [Actinomycetospora succinea]TDQ46962.1 enoyl-ACP reductase-like protein [Actinomycetospora succinea]